MSGTETRWKFGYILFVTPVQAFKDQSEQIRSLIEQNSCSVI